MNFISPYFDDGAASELYLRFDRSEGQRGMESGGDLINLILNAQDDRKGPLYVLSVDGRDSDSVSSTIDLSREALGLSPMDDVYPNDAAMSDPVKKQFGHYAKYLKTKGLRLVELDMGSDSFTAVVVSQTKQDAFKPFVKETFRDIKPRFM